MRGIMCIEKSTVEHYELLIEEGVDFVHDPPILREYMNSWTGDDFFDYLDLNENKDVLEVGSGTGRIGLQILDRGCNSYLGIDVSQSTISKAKFNLRNYDNVRFKAININSFTTENRFDVICSVLTFIHIKDKYNALRQMKSLLKPNGSIILAVDLSDNAYLDYGVRKVKLFPNTIDAFREIGDKLGFRNIEYKYKYRENDLIGAIIKLN